MTPFLATVLLVLLAPGEAVAAEGWRRPMHDGTVTKAFSYDRGAPFARGARRGIDVAASPGARVLAVCAGVVTWAGPVPGWGRGVTLRCPRGLVATELGLRSVGVERGATVVPGMALGRLWSRGVLRVGARRGGDRFGWIDPAPLFEDDRAVPPLAPVLRPARRPSAPRAASPRAVAPRAAAHRRAPVPAPAPRSGAARAVPAPPATVSAPAVPLPVLLGVALLATAATGGPVVARRRRGRPIAEIAVAQR